MNRKGFSNLHLNLRVDPLRSKVQSIANRATQQDFARRLRGAGVGRLDRQQFIWMSVSLLVILGGFVAIMQANAGSNSNNREAALATASNQVSSTTAPEVLKSDGEKGRPHVLVNGRPMFPTNGIYLGYLSVNEPMMAQGLTVYGVKPGVGVWAGPSESERIWVQYPDSMFDLNGSTRSGDLKTGDIINFSGRINEVPYGPITLPMDPSEMQRLQQAERFVAANYVAKVN